MAVFRIKRIYKKLGKKNLQKQPFHGTPAARYFHYYVMPRSFFVSHKKYLICTYFRWRHWEITFSSFCFNKHFIRIIYYVEFFLQNTKLHLLELGLHDFIVALFIIQDKPFGGSFLIY